MFSETDFAAIRNATAHDSGGDRIGPVTDLYLDDLTGAAKWVAVSTGLLGTKARFVPLEGATLDGDRLTVAWSSDVVKASPSINEDGHLTPADEQQLFAHYRDLAAADEDADEDAAASLGRRHVDPTLAAAAGGLGAAGVAGVAAHADAEDAPADHAHHSDHGEEAVAWGESEQVEQEPEAVMVDEGAPVIDPEAPGVVSEVVDGADAGHEEHAGWGHEHHEGHEGHEHHEGHDHQQSEAPAAWGAATSDAQVSEVTEAEAHDGHDPAVAWGDASAEPHDAVAENHDSHREADAEASIFDSDGDGKTVVEELLDGPDFLHRETTTTWDTEPLAADDRGDETLVSDLLGEPTTDSAASRSGWGVPDREDEALRGDRPVVDTDGDGRGPVEEVLDGPDVRYEDRVIEDDHNRPSRGFFDKVKDFFDGDDDKR